MKFRVILPGLVFLSAVVIVPGAPAGEESAVKAQARLKELQMRVLRQEFQNGQLQRDLLAFSREQAGTALYPLAVAALARVPSPLDRLDAAAIDPEERRFLSIRDLVTFIRPHQRAVAHVALSSDGALLATSGWDSTVHVYKMGGKEPVSWAKLDGSASGIAFSPDSKMLAAGCGDTRVLLWEFSGTQPSQKYALAGHKNRPFCVTYSPDGKMFASGCYDPVLRIWKFDDGEPEAWAALANEKTSSLGISALTFSHDGKYLVAGSYIGKETLRLWDAGGNFLDEKTPPAAQARLLASSPMEPLIAFAGNDATIQLWSMARGRFEKRHTLSGHPGKSLGPLVKALGFSPDGKILASSGQDRRLRLWKTADGELLREWHFLDEVRALAFSSDGRHLAVGNSDGTLYVLRLETLPYKSD